MPSQWGRSERTQKNSNNGSLTQCPPEKPPVAILRQGGVNSTEFSTLIAQTKIAGTTLPIPLPGNAIAKQSNVESVRAYMSLCREFKLWKQMQVPQRRCPSTCELVSKIPKAPKPITLHMRWHCSQNFADPRTGRKCALGCVYSNFRFPIGKCPLCLCVCKAFIPLGKYQTIVTVSALPQERCTKSRHVAAQHWLHQGLNVNTMPQRNSSNAYRGFVANGCMVRGESVVNNVANEGALAQALDYVGNAPRDQQVVHTLRGIVDQTQDPHRPSYTNTSVGDMNVHGSAADDPSCSQERKRQERKRVGERC